MTLVLGIETSCDETAAAVVEDGRLIRSNVVATQIDIHARYGGVVPEVASRQHVLSALPVVERALDSAGIGWSDVDTLAVTHGPGLAGALLVGVNLAKGIAFGRGLSLVGVNHLEAHIYANWLHDPATDGLDLPPEPVFPVICLIVSGGHTDLILMQDHGVYRRLGRTRDDAAGEAFDKIARILGLGFPGGPAVQKTAEGADPGAFKLPRAWLGETYDFSFSGLKTAVLREVEQTARVERWTPDRAEEIRARLGGSTADLAASFQEAVVDVLVEKTIRAAREHRATEVLLCGGVAANAHLRARMTAQSPLPVRVARPKYCTDNAAMVAACGYCQARRGNWAGWDLDIEPNLKLVDTRPLQASTR